LELELAMLNHLVVSQILLMPQVLEVLLLVWEDSHKELVLAMLMLLEVMLLPTLLA